MTLPNIYTNPDTIVRHKNELLDKIKERLHSEPEWVVKKRILDQTEIFILNQPYKIIKSFDSKAALDLDFHRKTITRPEVISNRDKTAMAQRIIKNYHRPIEHRVRQLNDLTVAKKLYHVDIKNNQSSWGLCSSKGEITISLNTAFAPLWVIDYIIIHELCHLVHHDHSAQFWQLVERYYPKYKLAKKYLKEKGMELVL
jgi:hypothetical protein